MPKLKILLVRQYIIQESLETEKKTKQRVQEKLNTTNPNTAMNYSPLTTPGQETRWAYSTDRATTKTAT